MISENRNWKQNPEELERSWETIGISNDFLFGKLMREHPGLCQKLLQRILPELQIDHIEVVEPKKSNDEDMDAQSVRLDAYVGDDSEQVCAIEIQMTDAKELPKKSRCHSAMLNNQLLNKDIRYDYLNDSYIIFICPFDLYGKGRHMYTFDKRCKEDPELTMGDGATHIFLNTKGTMEDVSASLRAFLDYVDGRLSDDSFVQELEEAVDEAKKNREWRHEYMTLMLRDQENIEKGIELGRAEGRAEGRTEGRAEERQEGIRLMVSALWDFGIPKEEIRRKIQEKYQLTGQELEEYLK